MNPFSKAIAWGELALVVASSSLAGCASGTESKAAYYGGNFDTQVSLFGSPLGPGYLRLEVRSTNGNTPPDICDLPEQNFNNWFTGKQVNKQVQPLKDPNGNNTNIFFTTDSPCGN